MKIWIVNQYALAPDQSGGTRHYSFAKALQERGHEVTIIASGFSYQTHEEERLSPEVDHALQELGGVPFLWLRSIPYKGNSVMRLLNMIGFGWDVAHHDAVRDLGEPDVVIGSSPQPFAALGAYALAKRFSVPFLFEVRDLWPKTFVDMGALPSFHPLVALFGWAESFLYKRASGIVTLLQNATDYIVSKGGARENVTWIPNAVDPELANAEIEPVLDIKQDGVLQVIYAGAHGLANGLDHVLDAAKLLTDQPVRFVFIGDGQYKKSLENRVQEEEINNVVFFDSVSKEKVYGILKQADIALMPLKNAPVFQHGISPNKLFDYMVCSLPVVFSVSSEDNLVEKTVCGFSVEPENEQEIANAIIELVNMGEKERQVMGARGLAYIEGHHLMPLLADRFERVLQRSGACEEKQVEQEGF